MPLRGGGDAEGGALFVEADPRDPSRVRGFDVEVAEQEPFSKTLCAGQARLTFHFCSEVANRPLRNGKIAVRREAFPGNSMDDMTLGDYLCSARSAQALSSLTSLSRGTRWIRAAQLSGIKRAVIAKTPRRMSGQPWLRNTSYVDGQFDRIDQTRVRGVIRSAMFSFTESLVGATDRSLSRARPPRARVPDTRKLEKREGLQARASIRPRVGCSEKLGWPVGSLGAYIYLANNVLPLFGLPQLHNEFVERLFMLRRVFEPGEKIKGFPKIIAVVKAPCDCRKILQTRLNVPRS
jgi:hypothetical protein